MKKIILTILCTIMFFGTTFAETIDFVNSDGSAERVTIENNGFRTDVSTRHVYSGERETENKAAQAVGVIALACMFPTATAVVVGSIATIAICNAIFGD